MNACKCQSIDWHFLFSKTKSKDLHTNYKKDDGGIEMETNKTTLLTVSEMAKELKIGRNKAYELISSNEVKYIKIGKQIRIPYICLQDWINNKCI